MKKIIFISKAAEVLEAKYVIVRCSRDHRALILKGFIIESIGQGSDPIKYVNAQRLKYRVRECVLLTPFIARHFEAWDAALKFRRGTSRQSEFMALAADHSYEPVS